LFRKPSKPFITKITDLKCALIDNNSIVHIVTNESISGYGEAEQYKPYHKPWVPQFREALIGEDPTDVERCMFKIRQRGSFKPYGAPVSIIEHALWDIAGETAGVSVYKLLGGKVRDQVRTYNGSIRCPIGEQTPESMAKNCRWMKSLPEGFDIIKQGIAFHSAMKNLDHFFYEQPAQSPFHGQMDQGTLTERGLTLLVDCVSAMKEVLGDGVGLALDCVPG
jgi:L-alanine-DL-glutamate epimerase-like enolase superfamily enzyme